MKHYTPELVPDGYYHIFNHAASSENLFRNEANYRVFLKKYAEYISPVADTFAYCLMLNHFHFAFRIKSEAELSVAYADLTGFSKHVRSIHKTFFIHQIKNIRIMIKINLILLAAMLLTIGVRAQNLDRMSLSSGGAATDNVNYVLGETFNFTLAQGGTISLETGTLSSTGNTGGQNNFVKVLNFDKVSQLTVYPNPAVEFANLNLTGFQNLSGLLLAVYDAYGKVVKMHAVDTAGLYLPVNIDVAQLPAGVYFISVSDVSLKPVATAKFVKQ